MSGLKIKNTVLALVVASLIASSPLLQSVVAEDWPQFRGPNGSGVSASTGLPDEFGPNKNVIWKTALPPGHSSPVLTHNRIFVTAYSAKQPTASGKQQGTNQREREAELQTPRHLSRPSDGKASLAARSAARGCRTFAEREWTRPHRVR